MCRFTLLSSLLVFLVRSSDAFLTASKPLKRASSSSIMMNKAGATTAAAAALLVAGIVSTVPVMAIETPSHTIAGIEIVPSGGGGFGGLGISPFGWGPFGGFGFGFGIRSTPEPGVSIRKQSQPAPPLDKEQQIERAKAELEATKEYQKQLSSHIQKLTSERQQDK